MEPRSPSVLWDDPEPEEPTEVIDYYEAMQMEWLSSGVVEDVGTAPSTPGPREE